MTTVLVGAAVAHLWDLMSFLVVVPLVGAEAEVGPIGMVYATYGPVGAMLYKVGGFALAAFALTMAAGKYPKAAEAGWLVLLTVGLVGALANTFALSQMLEALGFVL